MKNACLPPTIDVMAESLRANKTKSVLLANIFEFYCGHATLNSQVALELSSNNKSNYFFNCFTKILHFAHPVFSVIINI